MKENLREYLRRIDNMANKLKILLLIAYLFLGFFIINAQSKYNYYYKGEKVGLILDKKHYLTVEQVNDIIERTSQKINPDTYAYTNHLSRPNGTWNKEVGYGLVDAYAAVQMALSPLDLYIKDSSDDIGEEPNETTLEITNSPDIWIRNNPDGIHQDQDPLYQHPDQYHPKTKKLNYVYFRVRNRGSIPTRGDERLILYWSKTSSGLSWPEDWDGTSVYDNGHVKGDPIGSITIPALEPGEETTLFIPWQVPYQDFYEDVDPSPSKYTLLARIESSVDPMTTEETSDVRSNAINNNNIALKSVTAKPRVDLHIKDFDYDLGLEPNRLHGKMWISTGIWVRNNPDGIQEHQNPKYGTSNYLYAKITNIGSISSTGNEQLKLYWSKAGTALTWPTSWDGTLYNDGVLMGAPIGTLTIPVLAPGEEIVLSIPWQMPNPNDYIDINPSPWHFCFLARIVSDRDPMAIAETRWMSANARNNNNIAWKNVIAVKASSNSNTRKRGVEFENTRSFGGVISVGNPFDDQRTFSLELVKEDLEGGKAIFDEAEVSITMDQTLYNAWVRAGGKSELIEGTHDKNKKLIRGNHALLDGLTFKPSETGTLNLTFNFLTEELTDKSRFVYHVIQRDAETSELIGGETYIITKDSRPLFVADAGEDQFIYKNEAVTIRAKQLEEVALYNWYDAQGKLIHKGRDLIVSPAVAQKYKLEVIASDGFKDYDEVEVKLSSGSFKDSYLDKIIPNPVTGTARITYNLGQAKSAYLMVVGFYDGATNKSNNYILEAGSQDTTIRMDNYLDGYYKVALVCEGKIVNVKTFIKQ